MVRAAGVEPTTFGFGGRHSIQLSYARNLPDNLIRSPAPTATASQISPNGQMGESTGTYYARFNRPGKQIRLFPHRRSKAADSQP